MGQNHCGDVISKLDAMQPANESSGVCGNQLPNGVRYDRAFVGVCLHMGDFHVESVLARYEIRYTRSLDG